MDTLRWILLILGIMILVGIYLAGRMRAPRRRREPPREKLEPDELEHVHIRADDGFQDPPRGGDELEELRDLVVEEVRDRPVAMTVKKAAPSMQAREEKTALSTGKTSGAGLLGRLPKIPGLGGVTDAHPPARERTKAGPATVSVEPAESIEAMEPPAPASPEPVERPGTPDVPQEKLVVLHVVAGEDDRFLGVDLATALTAEGMEFGDMNIYHYLVTAGRRQLPVFSLANMLNPGTFDPQFMDEFTTPGVTLFLQLPGPCDGVESFDAMYHCAEGLAERLKGQVLDASRSALTRQGSEHIREDIRRWQLRAGLGSAGR
ncbi:cell division protein ZipA [Ectothiorhodospira shaposhnikovii]|uniref:cell division protein ZipA n=1 Tax=Ectothiorhodospira shaposhnikovii TaxID=1054 RepID=UPI001903128E|nr:cell division protein ZipA [Ectothiorhodospira shaposhnikovii]MBK1673435.1 cell division protein ZipA [Ectothiorhodospira shaposhnikovii]